GSAPRRGGPGGREVPPPNDSVPRATEGLMTVHESVDRDAEMNAGPGGLDSGSGLVPDSDKGDKTDLRDAGSSQRIDTLFRSLTVAAGAVIVALIALIGIVLVTQAT